MRLKQLCKLWTLEQKLGSGAEAGLSGAFKFILSYNEDDILCF